MIAMNQFLKIRLVRLIALLVISLSGSAYAEVGTIQSLPQIKKTVEEFLITQTIAYPGQVTVSAGNIDNNLRLASCPAVEAFMPPGSRAWGRTTVGVRCNAPSWVLYIQANVSVMSQYLVAATPLLQGRVVSEKDFIVENGDLAQMPAGVFTDTSQVVGRIVNVSLNAGTVMRQEMLKLPPVVQQGQKVVLTSMGKGFQISAEGQALTSAGEGQIVKVKVASGQVVSGIARDGGQIEVRF